MFYILCGGKRLGMVWSGETEIHLENDSAIFPTPKQFRLYIRKKFKFSKEEAKQIQMNIKEAGGNFVSF